MAIRENGDFLNDLRHEISQRLELRNSLIKSKLTFMVGFLGLGIITIPSSAIGGIEINTKPVFYFIPLVVFIFDLFIMSQDFGIKRAGRFLKTCPSSPTEERRWELHIMPNRDIYSFIANPLAALSILVACNLGIYWNKIVIDLHWFIPWILLSLIFSLSPLYHRRLMNSRLTKFEASLRKEFEAEELKSKDSV